MVEEGSSIVTREQNIESVWGFFNNDYSGYAIATCRRFMRRMGLAVPSSG